MALNIDNIRSLFFDAAGNEIAEIDNALLQAFMVGCDAGIADDLQVLVAAEAMLDAHGVLIANVDPIPGLINLTRHPVTTGDVLAVIARRTNLPEDLRAIVNHANHDAASDTAVINNVNTAAADLVILAGRTVVAADLNNIVNHANGNAASDTAVINNGNTAAADLVILAGRTVVAADLHNIVNHANHNAASDIAVINNANTLAADLVTIAGRTVVPADLNHIVNHANHNAASDTAVINNANTLAADLVTIAGRTVLAADLHNIVNHANHNAASDLAVMNNPNTEAADLAILAGRTGLADLHIIVNHANHNAASDTAVINNPNTVPDNLAIIANRTLDVANLAKIAEHNLGNFPQVLNAIIQNVVIDNANRSISDNIVLGLDKTELDAGRLPRLNAASLAAIAARTKSIDQLNYIANHPNANDALVLNAIVRNEAVGRANRAESDRKVSELEQAWLANPAHAPRLVVESVLEIAKRATHVEALRQIAAYPVTNIDILREVIGKRNADDAEVIHGIVAINQDLIDIGHAGLLEVADLMNLIKFRNVAVNDLITIINFDVVNAANILRAVISYTKEIDNENLINAIFDKNNEIIAANMAELADHPAAFVARDILSQDDLIELIKHKSINEGHLNYLFGLATDNGFHSLLDKIAIHPKTNAETRQQAVAIVGNNLVTGLANGTIRPTVLTQYQGLGSLNAEAQVALAHHAKDLGDVNVNKQFVGNKDALRVITTHLRKRI